MSGRFFARARRQPEVNGAFRRNEWVLPLIWGTILALAVCIPFFGDRRLFLLDWSYGPVNVVTSAATLGLNGGLVAENLPSIVLSILSHLIGSLETWLPIFVFFPIASVGISRLVGSSKWAQMAASSLYAVNPFVLNRLFAGQIALLLGYALIPFALASILHSPSSRVVRWIVPPVWWGILTALSPHFAWIFWIVIFAVAFSSYFFENVSPLRLLTWFSFVTSVFAAMSAYIYFPTISTTLPTQVGMTSLELYRTSSDPHLGLYANVAALYGFWRIGPGPQMAKDIVTGWPFLLAVILIVVGVGVHSAFRHMPHATRIPMAGATNCRNIVPEGKGGVKPTSSHSIEVDRRHLTLILITTGVLGYFLALGNQGPTGAIYTRLYDDVPFFNIMREPQKFLLLLAMAYAVFFGWGVEKIESLYKSKSWVGSVSCSMVLAFALPLGYTINIFDGLAHQIVPSSIPRAYESANTIMGKGNGSILSLPWHNYMSYPFTNGRVVANIAQGMFDRNVISGDNVETEGIETQSTSQRSMYLQFLFSHSRQIDDFGALVSPLGIQYVTLAKSADWQLYSWLNHQHDLSLVIDSPTLEVWRNASYFGVGEMVQRILKVPSVRELLTLTNRASLGGAVLENSPSLQIAQRPRPSVTSRVVDNHESEVREISPVAYKITPGRAGWVEVSAPYQMGWSINGQRATESAEGTLLIKVDSRGGTLVFAPWSSVRTGYVVSMSVLLICVVIMSFQRRRRSPRFNHKNARE